MTSSSYQHFVAGFLFDYRGYVALVHKLRPEWQAGKVNAIGGKVEEGETALDAMQREFHEEAGLHLTGWQHFATLELSYGKVDFFRLTAGAGVLSKVKSMTDEKISIHHTMRLPKNVVPNLTWLIPLALYDHDEYEPITAKEIE